MRKHIKTNQSDYVTMVKEDLKNYLVSYIEANGIRFQGQGRGKFQCPNHAAHRNGDRNFSAGFTDKFSSMEWKCFACNIHGDIYSLANILHNLPLEGVDFFLETIPSVANAIGYIIDEDKYFKSVNETLQGKIDIKEIQQAKKINKRIEDLIQDRKDPDKINEDYNRKNYSEDLRNTLSLEFDIFFPQPGDFDFLPDDHPLSENKEGIKDHIVWGNKMVFPVHNKHGKLIGLKSRRPNSEIEKGKSKYYHVSLDKNAKINFFNLHRALPEIKKNNIIYIFEADFDCMIAYSYGLKNSIATGVTPDTGMLLSILKQGNAKEAVLVMDADNAGDDATVRIASALISNGYPCTVFPLPKGIDADEYIIEKGSINDFKDPKKRQTIPEFMILNGYGLLSSSEVADTTKYAEAVDIVTRFTRNIATVNKYAKLIAEKFGIKAIEDIEYDIIRQIKSKKDPIIVQCNTIIKDSIDNIVKEPDIEQKLTKLEELTSNIQTTFSSFFEGSETEDQSDLDSLLNQGDEEARNIIYTGFKQIDSAIRLMPGSLVALSARPSVGKSSFVRSLIRPVIENNRNVVIIHHSLDDSRYKTMDGIISNLSRVTNTAIESGDLTEEELERIAEAHEQIRKWWKRSYYLYGQETIQTTEHIISTVTRAKRRNPDAQILLIVDNLMNLGELNSNAAAYNKRTVVEGAISRLHRATQQYNITSMIFVELRRDDKIRPTIDMIKETGSIEYAANIVGLMHNDLKMNEHSNLYWIDENMTKQPVLEMYFPKFKTGEPNKHIFLKAKFAYNDIEEASEQESKRFKELIDQKANNERSRRYSRRDDYDEDEDGLF